MEQGFSNPFQGAGTWVRTCLHCHTSNSDGGLSVADTISRYSSLGYRCICITDHRMVSRASRHSGENLVVVDSIEVGGNPDVIGIGVEEPPDPNLPLDSRVSELYRQGAFTIAAHPTYCAALPQDYLPCEGLMAIEIYNAYCEEAYANGVATEVWDMLLGEGKRVWGVASDDAHLNPKKRYYSDAGHAWVEAWVPELSGRAVLSSLKNGAFYSTQGPKFTGLDLGETPSMTCTPVKEVRWRTRGSTGFVERPTGGNSLTRSELPDWFRVRGYLRVELVDQDGLRAWSNPFFPSE